MSWSQNQVAFYLIFHEVIFFLAITIMPQISAPGAYLILEDPGWALIRGGRLFEGGTYFKIY